MNRSKVFWSFVWHLVAFSLFVVIDPFGLASMTSTASQRFVYRTLSLFEPPAGADSVAIVLVDDNSAAKINGERGYPLTFAQHAGYLRPVLCSGPSAFFMDISFRGLRDSTPLLTGVQQTASSGTGADLLSGGAPQSSIDVLVRRLLERPAPNNPRCELPEASYFPSQATKIFTVRVPSYPDSSCDPFYGHDLTQCPLGNVLERLASAATPISAGTIRPDGSYVLASPYPGSTPEGRGDTLEPSPALAMVIAFCERAAGTPRADLPGCRDISKLKALLTSAGPEELKLAPQWSFYKTRTAIRDRQRFGGGTGCKAEQWNRDASYLSKAERIALEFWQALLPVDDPTSSSPPCLPEDVVSLYDAGLLASQCGENQALCTDRLASLFAGRMVFYGSDITGINDQFPTPVVGNVPGVAYHAAVAENLINLGGEYRHMPTELFSIGGITVNYGHAVDIAAFFIASALLYFLRRMLPSRPRRSSLSPCQRRAIILFTSAAVLAAAFAAVSLGLAAMSDLPTTATVIGIAIIVICTMFILVFGFDISFTSEAFADSAYKCGETLALKTPLFPILMAIAVFAVFSLDFPPINFVATILILPDVGDD